MVAGFFEVLEVGKGMIVDDNDKGMARKIMVVVVSGPNNGKGLKFINGVVGFSRENGPTNVGKDALVITSVLVEDGTEPVQ